MSRPARRHAYCYNDRRYVIAGASIPARVVEQVYVDMRLAPFRVMDVARYCEHALRQQGGPITCAQGLADRIVRDCRDAGVIRVAVEGRFKTWEWTA